MMLQTQPTVRKVVSIRSRDVPTPTKELYSHDAPKPADHQEGCQKLEQGCSNTHQETLKINDKFNSSNKICMQKDRCISSSA
jgi:hypothetical protein